MRRIPRRRGLNMRQKRALEGFLFISPWILGFLIFFTIPFFQSVRLSFSKITKIAGFQMEWAGMGNYTRAFVWDIKFIPLLIQTSVDAVVDTPLTIVFSLFIAILINKDIRFRGFFRASFFLPVLLGTGFVMKQLLGMDVEQQATEVARGIVMPEEILLYLGPAAAAFVNGFISRITIIFWKSGVQVIIFLAGLQGIPESMYEAARCDGAKSWEMFWKITLPMISPVILLNAVYTLVDSFTASTNPIVEYILSLKTNIVNYEYATAMGMIYFVSIFALIALTYAIFKKAAKHAYEK